MDEKLTNTEQLELAEYEAAIGRNLTVFYETGQALLKIRDERLYRAAHETFAEYCKERWDMKRAHAYRLIESALIVQNLSPIGDIKNLRPMGLIPATESQARELAGLDPESQRKIWERAIETAPNGHITAAHIRETREALIDSPEQEELFTLEDYRQAIDHHVSAANHHKSLADYHIRKAKHLRDEAFKRYHVQIPLPFEREEQ